jgi:hypothetical protein
MTDTPKTPIADGTDQPVVGDVPFTVCERCGRDYPAASLGRWWLIEGEQVCVECRRELNSWEIVAAMGCTMTDTGRYGTNTTRFTIVDRDGCQMFSGDLAQMHAWFKAEGFTEIANKVISPTGGNPR